jgi:cell division control protein 24
VDAIQEDEADGTDHVRSLWNCFRNGLSLLAIYNAFQPGGGILVVEKNYPDNRYKNTAVFMFIRACMLHLRIPASELFTLKDMYGSDTMAFFKMVKVINRVVDMLEMNGKLLLVPVKNDLSQVKGKTKRDYILNELVESEIQYVHHLYDLCQLKKELEDEGALTGDVLHDIFLNLNSLSNFAQTFLIRVEQHYELSEDVQNWGDLFNHYKEPSGSMKSSLQTNEGAVRHVRGSGKQWYQKSELQLDSKCWRILPSCVSFCFNHSGA